MKDGFVLAQSRGLWSIAAGRCGVCVAGYIVSLVRRWRDECQSSLCSFFLFPHFRITVHGVVAPTFRVGLPFSAKSLGKHPNNMPPRLFSIQWSYEWRLTSMPLPWPSLLLHFHSKLSRQIWTSYSFVIAFKPNLLRSACHIQIEIKAGMLHFVYAREGVEPADWCPLSFSLRFSRSFRGHVWLTPCLPDKKPRRRACGRQNKGFWK